MRINIAVGNVYNVALKLTKTNLWTTLQTKPMAAFYNNNLKGWINEKDGQTVLSSAYNSTNHHKLAFFGIHVLSGKAISLMKSFPDKFSIINFYLSICDNNSVGAYIANDNHMVDVGRLTSLNEAEEFLKNLKF